MRWKETTTMLLERYNIIGSFADKIWDLVLGFSCNNHGQISDFMQ